MNSRCSVSPLMNRLDVDSPQRSCVVAKFSDSEKILWLFYVCKPCLQVVDTSAISFRRDKIISAFRSTSFTAGHVYFVLLPILEFCLVKTTDVMFLSRTSSRKSNLKTDWINFNSHKITIPSYIFYFKLDSLNYFFLTQTYQIFVIFVCCIAVGLCGNMEKCLHQYFWMTKLSAPASCADLLNLRSFTDFTPGISNQWLESSLALYK